MNKNIIRKFFYGFILLMFLYSCESEVKTKPTDYLKILIKTNYNLEINQLEAYDSVKFQNIVELTGDFGEPINYLNIVCRSWMKQHFKNSYLSNGECILYNTDIKYKSKDIEARLYLYNLQNSNLVDEFYIRIIQNKGLGCLFGENKTLSFYLPLEITKTSIVFIELENNDFSELEKTELWQLIGNELD